MPLYSATCPLPKNQMLRRHQVSAPFSPTNIAGLALWLKADAGVTTDSAEVVTQIVLSGGWGSYDLTEPTPIFISADGTYTRAGTSWYQTFYRGNTGSYIWYSENDLQWYLFLVGDFNDGNNIFYNSGVGGYTTRRGGNWDYQYNSVVMGSPATSTSTSIGTGVDAWVDQSRPNGYIFVPDYVSKDITLSSSVAGLNNKPAISFQALNDAGDVGLFNSNVFTGKSVFLVYILNSVDNFTYSVPYENSGINNYTSYNEGNRYFGGYFNEFVDANNPSTIGSKYLRTTITEDGTSINYYTNGSSDGNPTGDGFYTRSEVVIGNGGARWAGGDPSINQPFQGYLAEVVVYDVALTTPQRQQVEAYLNTKYAIY